MFGHKTGGSIYFFILLVLLVCLSINASIHPSIKTSILPSICIVQNKCVMFEKIILRGKLQYLPKLEMLAVWGGFPRLRFCVVKKGLVYDLFKGIYPDWR